MFVIYLNKASIAIKIVSPENLCIALFNSVTCVSPYTGTNMSHKLCTVAYFTSDHMMQVYNNTMKPYNDSLRHMYEHAYLVVGR